jgi:hypothetical protein
MSECDTPGCRRVAWHSYDNPDMRVCEPCHHLIQKCKDQGVRG